MFSTYMPDGSISEVPYDPVTGQYATAANNYGVPPSHPAVAEAAAFGDQMATDRKWGIALALAGILAYFAILYFEAKTVGKVVDAGVDYVHRH